MRWPLFVAQAPTVTDYFAFARFLATQHPWVTAASIFIGVIILFAAVAAAILLGNKEVLATIKELVARKADDKLIADRDRANELRTAADEALKAISAEGVLSNLALTVAKDTVQRFNRIRFNSDDEHWQSARVYLIDWIQRIFGFAASDVNKVTVWLPGRDDPSVLVPLAWNGMSPESARDVRLKIAPTNALEDTFAAMAFRSGELQYCDDTKTDPRYHNLGRPPTFPYLSLVAAPMMSGDRPVAVLTVDSLFHGTFSGRNAQQLAQLSAALMCLMVFDAQADPRPENP